MPTAAPTFVPQKVKTSILKIYSYKDRNPRGILINPCFKEGASFQNLTQLLFLIEDLQNGLNYPQKGMDDRSFDKKNLPQPSVRNAFRGAPPSGKCLATFQVNILFRQNASWQGNVVWTEQKVESPFRSTWELIMLMDGALARQAESADADSTVYRHTNRNTIERNN